MFGVAEFAKNTAWGRLARFVLDLLHEEHVLVVHGSGFSPTLGKGHFRIVYLPNIDVLNEAFNRIESFLLRHR